jgi:hypothetical protein
MSHYEMIAKKSKWVPEWLWALAAPILPVCLMKLLFAIPMEPLEDVKP